jgi:NADH:ubiquinone reductase (H+-translocating)
VIWAAGVSAVPLTQKLGVELDRQGRVKVNPDLSLPGHPEVFAIGDMALVLREDGQPTPGVSPAAMQMARHVARIIKRELDETLLGRANVLVSPNCTENARDQGSRGRSPSRAGLRPPFKYWDKGTMATIGRSAAVAWIGRLHFSGWFAWLTWLYVHLIFLIGFRNKLAVLLEWTYSYFTYKRGARIVTDQN